MNAKKIIVHFLIKNENQQKATIDLSQELLEINEKSLDLIERLNLSYKNTQITYAFFNDDGQNVFPIEFEKYYNKFSEKSFLEFSQKTAINLKEKIENISPAKGGYLVFCEYEVLNRSYIAVYLIRDTIGMLFRKDNNKSAFVIRSAEHLDLDKLAMACRINLEQYKAGGGKYLSFMKRKMYDISEYFINWISIQDRENNKTLTESLYELINTVDLPEDETGQEISRDIFRERVFNYISTLDTKIVNINDLSEHFYSNETFLRDYAETNNLSINTEFVPDNRIMKKFIRIDLDSDGIHVRFSREDLKTKIWFDEDHPNRVIIESEKFVGDLKREVEQGEVD